MGEAAKVADYVPIVNDRKFRLCNPFEGMIVFVGSEKCNRTSETLLRYVGRPEVSPVSLSRGLDPRLGRLLTPPRRKQGPIKPGRPANMLVR